MAAEGLPSSISPSPAVVVLSPCAACRTLRRRCQEDRCVLAPYFPPTEPIKFAVAHRVFGASNIIKLLKGLPDSCRADAVNSLVYEANARLRDPVYGCTGTIYLLQQQITELQAELAKAQVQVFNLQAQNSNLSQLLFIDNENHNQELILPQTGQEFYDEDSKNLMSDGYASGVAWEPLWR